MLLSRHENFSSSLDDATMGIQLPLEFRIRTSLKSTVVLLNPECYRGNKRRPFGCIGGPKLKSSMLCLRICLDHDGWNYLISDSEFIFVIFSLNFLAMKIWLEMQIKVWIDKGFNFWRHNLIILFIVMKSFYVQWPVQKLKGYFKFELKIERKS